MVLASLTHTWENPIPFTVDQWNQFCAEGGDVDEDEEDEDVDDEVLEDIVSDDEKVVKDVFDEEDDEKKNWIRMM